jgi:DNA-binding response OmpR family regulator
VAHAQLCREISHSPFSPGVICVAETEAPAAVLLDLELTDGSGPQTLREIKTRQPQAVVIMITAKP